MVKVYCEQCQTIYYECPHGTPPESDELISAMFSAFNHFQETNHNIYSEGNLGKRNVSQAWREALSLFF